MTLSDPAVVLVQQTPCTDPAALAKAKAWEESMERFIQRLFEQQEAPLPILLAHKMIAPFFREFSTKSFVRAFFIWTLVIQVQN